VGQLHNTEQQVHVFIEITQINQWHNIIQKKEMLNAHTRYFEIQYTINFGTFFFGFGAFNKK
jgi:hypothetical protein